MRVDILIYCEQRRQFLVSELRGCLVGRAKQRRGGEGEEERNVRQKFHACIVERKS